jgi:hypothetical protein
MKKFLLILTVVLASVALVTYSLSAYRGSCNIPSHKCRVCVDGNGDNYCDNCWRNGYKCHVVYHNVVR